MCGLLKNHQTYEPKGSWLSDLSRNYTSERWVPASAGGKGRILTSVRWQVTLCDPIWTATLIYHMQPRIEEKQTQQKLSITDNAVCRNKTVDCLRTPCCLWSASIASGSIYDRKRAQMRLHNINCCVSSCTCGMAWPRGQLSTIRIWVPNRGSIRPNTNSPFGQLFGPVRTWIFGTALIQKYGTKTVRYWDYVGNITKKISILLHNLLVAVSKGMQAAKPCYKNFSSS